jgi:hypothetical protein
MGSEPTVELRNQTLLDPGLYFGEVQAVLLGA